MPGEPIGVDPLDHASRRVGLAKRAAPVLTRVTARPSMQTAMSRLTMYLHFIQGQGAGTGWDQGETAVAAAVLRGRPDPVVLDCGANAGDWTLGVREHLGHARGTWILVEPTKEYVARLEHIPNVDIIAAAAGEATEVRDFFVPTEESGWMTLHERGDTYGSTKQFAVRQVDVVRLDTELESRSVERIDFAKLDVEGHELFVLRGMGDYLAQRRVRALAFEISAANVNSRTYFRDFWTLLTGAGYTLQRIAPGGRLIAVPSYYETLEYFRGATNYVAFAPGERVPGS